MSIRKMLLMFIVQTLVDKEWGWHFNHKRKGIITRIGGREINTDDLCNEELWDLLRNFLFN